MHNIKLDIPDITVVVEKGTEYLSTVIPSEIYQVLVNTGDNYNVVVDNHDTIVTNGSGSYLTVADYASTSSYALVAQSLAAGGSIIYDTISASNAYFGNLIVSNSITANLFTGSFRGDGSQLTGVGVSGGTNRYIPLWTGTNTLSSSLLFQTGSSLLLGSTTQHTPEAPDRFGVFAGITNSYNLISAHGQINNYLQLNIKNFSSGVSASSDIVATADVGTENSGYINLGINSTGYNVPNAIGYGLDGYLYLENGNDLLIGNTALDKNVIIFTGGKNSVENGRLFIDFSGSVGVNTQAFTANAQEALLIKSINNSTYNLIGAVGEVDNYIQFNIKNTSTGSNASSDVVATADNGDETKYYIDMGINNSQFSGLIGGPNDAYLYSTGSMLHIGNATPNQHVMFFAGDSDVELSRKLTLEANNNHTLTGSLNISGSITTLPKIINNLTASFAMTASYVSSAASTWDIVGNKPIGLVSSSIQINTGSFSGSFVGTLIGTSSWATNAISASYAPTILPSGTISSSAQVNYSQLQNIPSNIVSSSTQASTWTVASSSVATSASYAPTILPNGTVSSSAQVDYNSIQNQPTTIPTASYVLNSISASYALTASYVSGAASDWDSVANKPSGLVSSSTQINTGSFSGSFTGTLIGTSSWATNAISSSYAPTILPTGTVSSSAQVQLNQLTGTTFSASNFTFPQNLTVAGTLVAQEFITEYVSSSIIYDSGSTKFGDTIDDTHQFTGSVLISGSSVVIGSFTASAISAPITGSLFGTASVATLASAVEYANITNKPTLVSSSAQINTGSFSGSFTGQFIGTSSWATNAISSSYAPTILPSGTVSSSTQVDYTQIQNKPSVIATASYVDYSNIVNIPVGLVSSSTQVNYAQLQNIPTGIVSSSSQINTGSFSGSITSASFATSASYAPTILPVGVVSSSTQVNYTELQNIPSGIVSSSSQVTQLLPTGTVSSSTQINTGSFSGSFTGVLIGTGSWASNAISSSLATQNLYTASAAGNVITFTKGNGSTFTVSVEQSGTVETASYVEYSNIANKPTLISSSTQVDYNSIQNQPTTIPTASYVLNAVSSSFALTASYVSGAASDWDSVANKPSGLVSSSTQINTGSFSGSFKGTFIGTSSWASTASNILGGANNYLPLWTGTSTLSSSILYQTASNLLLGAIEHHTPEAPDKFGVFAGVTDSYNLISGHGEIDSYLQLNIKNFSSESNASSDIVATADTGTEFGGYINMGINSSNHNVPNSIGNPLDGYLFVTGSDLLIGNIAPDKKIILFNGAGTAIDNARVYIDSIGTVSINTGSATPGNPEALLVKAIAYSYNMITAQADINNYAQVNIFNKNSGNFASSDFVATANNGDENSYYIDMGINSENFAGAVGYANDAYLYTTGSDLLIGNISPNKKVILFAGSDNTANSAKIILDPFNQHQITGSLRITGSITVAANVVNQLTSSNAVSSSYAISASYAPTILPPNLVSSSLQINTGSFSGSFVGTLLGTATNAITASYALNGSGGGGGSTAVTIDTYTFDADGSTTNYVVSQSYNSSSLFISVNGLNYINPTDYTITSNTVVFTSAPVSESYIVIRALSNVTTGATGSFYGSFFGNIQSSSFATTSSFAISASWAPNTGGSNNWNDLINIPSGLVSSSTQASTWTVASSSVATSASYAPLILPSGVVSSSTQASTWTVASASIATTSSIATTASFAISASWAPSVAGTMVPVQDEGSVIVSNPIALNFIGAGVTVTNTSNTASITIPGGSGGDVAAKIVSASYSFGSSNEFIFTTGSFTVTLPSAVGVLGREYQIKNISTGTIFITGSHTIDDYSDITITEKNTALGLISNGINWSIF